MALVTSQTLGHAKVKDSCPSNITTGPQWDNAIGRDHELVWDSFIQPTHRARFYISWDGNVAMFSYGPGVSPVTLLRLLPLHGYSCNLLTWLAGRIWPQRIRGAVAQVCTVESGTGNKPFCSMLLKLLTSRFKSWPPPLVMDYAGKARFCQVQKGIVSTQNKRTFSSWLKFECELALEQCKCSLNCVLDVCCGKPDVLWSVGKSV